MDWKRIISDLKGRGLSEAKIAAMMGCSTQSTIHRLYAGEILDPAYSTGAALLRLHRRMSHQGTSSPGDG
jgi:predicted transcriptional regulator